MSDAPSWRRRRSGRPWHAPSGPPPRTARVCWRVASGATICTAWVEASLARLWYDEATAHCPGMEHRFEVRGGSAGGGGGESIIDDGEGDA